MFHCHEGLQERALSACESGEGKASMITIEGARQYFKNQKAAPDTSSRRSADHSSSQSIRSRETARKALLDVQNSLSDLLRFIQKQK